MFAPFRASSPLPSLTRDTVPTLSWIVPENVPLAPPLPTVSTGDAPPAALSIVPAPVSAPRVGLNPCRSSTPAVTASPLVPAPSAALLPNCKVPPAIVVPPGIDVRSGERHRPLPVSVKAAAAPLLESHKGLEMVKPPVPVILTVVLTARAVPL